MKISEGTKKTLQYVFKTKIYKFYVLSKVALSILTFNTLHVHVFI